MLHFGNQARQKIESSRYGESSKVQKSLNFKFNSKPYLQPSAGTVRGGGDDGAGYMV